MSPPGRARGEHRPVQHEGASASATMATALLAEALMLAPADIGPQTALGGTPQWDSLAHLRLVLGLEAALGRSLSTDEMLAIADVDSVAALLDGHAADPAQPAG